MSQNQNKQSYAHGFSGSGVVAGSVGSVRMGGTAAASDSGRMHEQRNEYNFGGGGGSEYAGSYWQQQQYQQQQIHQQVFQQRQPQQLQQRQQPQQLQLRQQQQLQLRQQQQLQQRQQQQQLQQREQPQQLQQRQQLAQRQQPQQLQQRQQQQQLQQREQQQLQQRHQHHQIQQRQQLLQQRQQQMQLQHRQQLQLQQRQQQQRQHDTMTMKSNAIESNVQVPTIEMDELIIKTEPPDDSGFVNLMENQGSKNVTSTIHRSTYLNNTSFPHIKEEPSTSQQKTLNFPRRKLQTERAETLPICQRCKQVFLKKSTYMKHVRHSSCSILEYNFKCLICPMSFMSQEELQAHESVHRADQFFCQKYCGKYFDTLDLCEAHEFMFHDFSIFTCTVCNANFKTRDVLFAHKSQHRHLNRFDCPICRQWFSTPSELRRHRLEAPFYCGKFYAEKEASDNQSIFNKISWNEGNYNLQDCNVGVIEETAPSSNISSNRTQTSKNNDVISNFQPDITIKSEPDFDNDFYSPPQSSAPPIAPHPARTHPRTDAFYHNVPTSYSNTDINNYTNIDDHAYNDFKSHYQHLERQNDNNFSIFSPPFIPATPAVSENDAICCVPHCGKRKSSNPTLQFFKYPKDEKYLKQWLHNMKLIYNAEESYEDYRICNLHFPKRVINLHSLCYWAVPTYHLGHDDFANIFHNREQSLSSVQCSIRGCESVRGKTNVKFFNFPSTETQAYMKWCQNSRLPLTSTEIRQICSRHFEEQCFGKLRLKNWALPTLHLGGFPVIHDNPRILFTEDKKCCLQHCRRKRSEDITLSFYGFPRDEQLLLRWCYNFRLDPNEFRGKFYKICSAHFVKDVIGTVKLLPGALPTLELGHNDPNIYTNELYPNSLSTHNTTSTSSNSSAIVGMQETPDTCSLPTCKRNRFSDNVSMHTMPGRSEQFQKWCHNLKINPAMLNKHFRVCSIHFEPYCIGGCMRPFAVPTLFLGHDDKNIYHNPKVIKKLSLRETCCVAVCRRNRERDRANLHSFPLHKPELLQKWLHNLQRPMPDGTRLFNDAICEQHFEERCIQNRRLAKWALPTLLLGHDDDIMQLPSEAEVEEIMAKTAINEVNNGDAGGECCVETCKRNTNSEENVKLYFLPDDEEVLEKWAHNLQQPDLKDYATTLRICNLHFESYCVGKKLHSWAIPTLNLSHQLEHIYENPSDMKVLGGLKAPNAPRCCLPSCRKMRVDGEVQLFRFPTYSKSIFKKWCHNLQISMASASSSHKRLCSTHFEPCVLTKRCPMPQALPTLNLNCSENYKIYQNPERLKLAKLRNERICCLASCRKGKKDGIQLFLYPHNRSLLRKWAHNTKQKATDCTRAQLRLCSDHFEENCFGPSRLIPGAIPTLKLGHDDDDIFPNTLPEISEDEQQCAISGCGRKRAIDGIRLFRFPADDEDLLWKWCNNLKLNPIDCPQQRICNMHFEHECIGSKGLHKWAIPTMLLGHNDAELQLHTNPKPEDRVCAEPVSLKCCVATCGKTRKHDDIMLNSFPKTPDLFTRWAHNLQMDIHFSEREKYKICNDHFESFCVGQARLRSGAIPTLNLGHDNTADIYPIERADLQGFCKPIRQTTEKSVIKKFNISDEIESEVELAKCCYPDCTASKSLQRDLLFDFPGTELLANEWFKAIDLKRTDISNPKLCGIHLIVVYEETAEARANFAKTNPELNDDLQMLANCYYRCCSSSLIRSMQCCIPECKTNSLSGIKLYQFPYQRELKEKWAHNTGIELDENQRHLYKVCALHFETHCMTESQRLRPWAIPTLHLQHSDATELYQNPDLLSLERRLLGPQTNKCCVPSCERHQTVDDNARLFNFPTEESMIDKWLHNLRVVEREKCPLYRICSWHFEKRCISKSGRLRSWAIPTLKLRNDNSESDDNGDEDDDIIPNPEGPSTAAVASKEPQQTAESVANNTTDVVKGCKMKKNLDLIKCCVPTCRKSRLQHGVRLFTSPSEMKMLRKWAHILLLPVTALKKQVHICNQHFAKRCIDGKQLHAWAIPTMNLGNSSSDTKAMPTPKFDKAVTQLENKEPAQQFNQYLPMCCVPNCGRRRTVENAMRTFGFPLNPKLLRRWCTNLKMDTSTLKGQRVCVYHFEEELQGKTKLKSGAVPTLNLGHDDGPTYDNKALLLALKEKENSTITETSVGNRNTNIETNIETNLEESTENITEISNENCCAVTGCTTTKSADDVADDKDDDNTQLFNFPTDSNLLQKWCENLQFKPAACDSLKICQRHFELQCFGKRTSLYMWAIPTLHLGLGELTPLPHDNSKNIKIVQADNDFLGNFKRCCIATCRKTRRSHGVTLFSFPKPSQLLLRKWCHNTRQAFKRRQKRRICSDHFEKYAMSNGKLRPWALPTLQLGHTEPIYENPTNMFDKCCITTCESNENTQQLFSFPKRSSQLRKWAHNTKQDAYLAIRRNYKVCILHFEKNCIGANGLNFGAIPTLQLGQQDVDADLQENFANEVVTTGDVDVSCSISNCGRKLAKDGIILFPFPKEQELLGKWCHNLKLKVENCEELYICNMHFESGQVRKYKLLEEAVPTLLLGHNDKTLELIKTPELSNTAPIIHCCAQNCNKSKPNDDVQMMGFPKNRTLYLKWLHNLKVKPNQSISRVCSDHFEDICMAASRIKHGSVPTLNLGHDDPNIYHNNKKVLITAEERRKLEKCVASDDCHVSKMLQLKLFDMPKLESTLQRWLTHFGVEFNDNIDMEPKICAIHFMDAYEKLCQLKDAVQETDPLRLDSPDEYKQELENLAATYKHIINLPRLRILLCSVPGCQTKFTDSTIRLIRFPLNPEVCAKWCHNTKANFDEERRYLFKVCSLHFEEYCYVHTRLHSWALPTLRLPQVDDIYQNPEPEEDHPEVCCLESCRPTSSIKLNDIGDVDDSTEVPEESTEVGRKLFSFPADETLLQKWCHNLDIPPNTETKGLKICSAHFENYSVGKVLRTWAIPTLKLNRDPTTLYSNPEIKDLPFGRTSTCCVRDCRQQRDDEAGIKLFAFPLKQELRQKWIHNLELKDHADDCRSYRVCSLHFERHCVGKRLHNWAIPTLRLCQDSETVLYKNPRMSKKKLNAKCCLKHCRKSRRQNQVRLFSFPETESQVLKKWMHNLKLDDAALKRKLCSSHFEKFCFYKGMKRVHPWAIPTLELGHKDVIFENPKGKKLKLQQLPTAKEKCALNFCDSQQNLLPTGESSIRFFGFPCVIDLLQQWCDNLKLDVTAFRCTKQRICEHHFEPQALNDRKLLPGAVPTLNLGHKEVIEHQNPADMSKYRFCSLAYCKAEMSDQIKLFDLPLNNMALLLQWCDNLQLNVEACKSGQYTKVCSAHFVPEVITGNTLRPHSVPTLQLGHDNSITHENSSQTLHSEVIKQCAVTDCAAHLEPHANLFGFPKKPKRLQKWCENLKFNVADSTEYHICREHFDSSCFDPSNDQSLSDWALPTLNLGHTEQIPYERRKSSSKLALQKQSQCCVTTCQSTTDVQLYKFPTINWLIKKWCYNLRRPEEGAEHLKICEKHFEKHCLGISKPRPWAIPTIELGHKDEIHQSMKIHKYHPEEKACGEMKFVRSNYCAIVSCLKSKQDGVQLYRYPSKGTMLHKWAHNCRHRAYQAARYIFRICSEHFEEQCLSGTAENRLRPGAIPTLKLGHDDIDIHPHEVLDCPTPSNLTELNVACDVPNCGRTKLVDNVRLFKFPKDVEMLTKWCYNLRLEMMNEKDAKNKRICNLHFEERCFSLRKIRLLLRAVPTLLLGHTDIDDIYENPESFERPEKVLRCCVPECGRAKFEDNVTLFCFPKSRKLFSQWAQNIRVELKPTTETYMYTRVCSMHFENYCSFGQSVRRLLFGAIPTLKLGHNDENIHHVKREMLSSTLGELRKRKREEDSIRPMVKRDAQCCVPKCGAKDHHIYALPQHATIQHMWYLALDVQGAEDIIYDDEKHICAIHFKIAYVKTHKQMMAVTVDDTFVAVLKDLTQTYNEICSSSRIRSIWCSVSGCCGNTFNGGAELKLYSFPHNSEIYEKWIHNTQVEVDDKQRYLFKVCTLHFEIRCVKEPSKRLHPWALPTLNLPLKDIPTVIIQNPSPEALESNNSSYTNLDKSCCITTCANAKKKEDYKSDNEDDDEDEKPLSSIILYKFPRDVHLFRKWLYNTQMDSNDAIHARICGRHFVPACIGKSLSPWAIPTLHLGHNKPNIHQNPKEEITVDGDGIENEIKLGKEQETKTQQVEKNSTLKLNKTSVDNKPTKDLLQSLLKKEKIKCASLESLLSPKWEQNKIARTSTPKEEISKKPIILELLSESCIKSGKQENSGPSLQTSNNKTEKTHDGNISEKSLSSVEDERIITAEREIVNEDENDDVIFREDEDDDEIISEENELVAVGERVIGEEDEVNDEEGLQEDEMDEEDAFDETAAFDAQQFGGTEFKEYNDEVFYSLGDEPADLLYATPTEDIQSCRVDGCSSRVGQPDIVLHKFPSNALLRNRWLHNTKVKWDALRPWAYKICSLHFEPQYYTSMTNRLTAYAIPTLNLGHLRPEKIYDTAIASNWKPGAKPSTQQIVKKSELKPLKPKPYPMSGLYEQSRQTQPTSSFNFKITAIESISLNASTKVAGNVAIRGGDDDDFGVDSDSNSVSSTEYQLQQYSDATNPSSASVRSSNTTNLSCSIPSCQRKTNQDYVQLHMLPKDTLLLQQWCHNCKLSPSPHELYTTRVCSYHFEDQCFTRSRRQLKLGSLPTLNLGHNDETYQNLRQPSAPLRCCIGECGRRRVEDQARLFRFPTDKRMLSKWLYNLQMEFNAARPWNYNVCEKHFEDYCFGKAGSIMPWAVPTLQLGSNGREQQDLRLNERPLEDQINDDDLFIMPDSTPMEVDSLVSAPVPNFNKKLSTDFKSNNVFYEQHFTFKNNLLQLKDDIKITTSNCFKCIVPNCGLIRSGDIRMQMFALPKDPQLRQKWIFNIKLLSYTYNPDNSADKICARHFERSAIIGPNVLKKYAVPTLNLGHADRNIYVNVDEEPKYLNHAYGSAADALQAMAKIKIEPFEEQQRSKADSTLLQFQQYENQLCSSSFAADHDPNSALNITAVVNSNSIKCFLKHCKRKRIDGVKLFRFPREPTLQAQWEHNLKMVFDDTLRERLFLCSTHFEPQFMGRKFLMKGAIPTLNLGHNDSNIFRADAWALSEESSESAVTPLRNGAGSGSFNTLPGAVKQSMQVSCCVPGCGLKDTGSDNALFFPFPVDEKYASIWQHRFRINYASRRAKLRVCNIHFEPHLICRKSLVQHAVPTLNLPPPVPHMNKQLSRVVSAPITSPSTSSNTCNVTGCHKNTLQDNVKMFSKFPDDFELFTKWCYNLKIDPRKYVDGKYNVCSSHFESYCIGGHSLRLWAVPTLNLGHNDANIHQVKRPAEMETKCCLPHCGRRLSTDGVTFYNFPKGDLYRSWCKILNIDELLYRNTDKKICSAHFTADCFNGLTLKAGVKPTLYLRARPAVAVATTQHHQPSNQQLFKIHDSQTNVPGCLLTHCSNNTTTSSAVQFYAFPDKRYLCMKWCHNLRLNYSSQMLYNKRIYKICFKHFELSCIYNGKLHIEAVPTLELGHTDVNIFQNTGSFSTLTNDSSSISSSSTGFANAMGGGSSDYDSSLLYVKEEIMDQDEMEPVPDVDMLNNFTATFCEPEM